MRHHAIVQMVAVDILTPWLASFEFAFEFGVGDARQGFLLDDFSFELGELRQDANDHSGGGREGPAFIETNQALTFNHDLHFPSAKPVDGFFDILCLPSEAVQSGDFHFGDFSLFHCPHQFLYGTSFKKWYGARTLVDEFFGLATLVMLNGRVLVGS